MGKSERWPFYLRFYEWFGNTFTLFAYRVFSRRLKSHGVSRARRREKLGFATHARPEGRLVWIHAASVGESLSVLPLAVALYPKATILFTTITATAAEVLAQRTPERMLHQFAPVDGRRPIRFFLDHWKPDLAIFVESEIWPQTLRRTADRGIPLVLMNARLSKRTLRNWEKLPKEAEAILRRFDWIVAQTEDTRDGLIRLGADPARVEIGGNMKAAGPPRRDDPETRAEVAAALGDAPVWAAVSTHAGEEQAVLDAHRLVLGRHPGARLILIPRHPARGDEVEALVRSAGFTVSRRSRGEAATAEVYLADTLGETGLWFRLAPVVFVAGSFVPVGGHNPWEPAHCGAAVLMGPLRETVVADMALLEAAGAALTVTDGGALGAAVADLLADPERLGAMREAARALAAQQEGRIDEIARRLRGMLR